MTCPYLTQSAEGTGYCTLAEKAVQVLIAERDKYLRRWKAAEQKLEMLERYAAPTDGRVPPDSDQTGGPE